MNHISQNTNSFIVVLLLIALMVACRVVPAPKPEPSATLAAVTEVPTVAVGHYPRPLPRHTPPWSQVPHLESVEKLG